MYIHLQILQHSREYEIRQMLWKNIGKVRLELCLILN